MNSRPDHADWSNEPTRPYPIASARFVSRAPPGLRSMSIMFGAAPARARHEHVLRLDAGAGVDALADALHDLSRVPEQRVTIVHDGAGAIGKPLIQEYFRLLWDRPGELPAHGRDLVVVLPEDARRWVT